jgi:hypothetical protein
MSCVVPRNRDPRAGRTGFTVVTGWKKKKKLPNEETKSGIEIIKDRSPGTTRVGFRFVRDEEEKKLKNKKKTHH